MVECKQGNLETDSDVRTGRDVWVLREGSQGGECAGVMLRMNPSASLYGA